MGNWLQRVVYYIANAVPLMIMTALVWYFEFKTWQLPVVLLAVSIVVAVLFAICFCYGKNNCATKNINVSKIISKDSWLIAYVFAYVAPFTYMVMSDFHIVSLIVVGIMLVLIFIPSVMALPNILLFFVGYHFYEIETESTGVGDYILISKRRRIRNKADVKKIMRVFEKLLIDTEEDK